MKRIVLTTLLAVSLFAKGEFTQDLQKEFQTKSIYTEKVFNADSYRVKSGWNELQTPITGIDVEKTFSKEQQVFVYDPVSKMWASNQPTKGQLYLKYIEPHMTFFLYTPKSEKVKIVSSKVDAVCQKLIDTDGYETVTDSGLTKEATLSSDKSVSVNSRYFSHYTRGVYNDTRIVMIYKELPTKVKKATFRYGPAEPKSMIKFAKEYEGQKFYMYDFYEKACYQGILPSMRIPPFAVLRKISK